MRLLLVLLLVLSLPTQAGLLAGGTSHALAVYAGNGGKVLAWGDNSSGQLGNGTTDNAVYAVEVFGLTNVISVAAGDGFSLALDSNGYVWAWGRNDLGQLGDTTTATRDTPVRVALLKGVVDIAAGRDFCLAAKSDGSVWGWGSNASGQLGQAAGSGSQYFTTLTQVSSLDNVQKVATGTNFSLALKKDGSVWAWGANASGQLGVGNTTDSVVPQRVSLPTDVVITELAARDHVLALQNDGKVWAWGGNDMGQLGDDTTTARQVPAQVVDIANVRSIAVASTWSMARRSDLSVWAWGDNSSGQLLDKTKTQRHYPVQAQGLADIESLASGPMFAVLGKYAGDILAWGANGGGQLGSGDTTDKYAEVAPVKKDADNPLVLTAVSTANPIATARTSGTAQNLTLTAVINPAAIDLGRSGFPLVWASVPGFGDIYLTVFGWFVSSVPMPYSGQGPLTKIEIPTLQNLDVSAFVGAKVYAGYGFAPSESASAARTLEIYAVP